MTDQTSKSDLKRQQMWKDIDLFLEAFYPEGCKAGKEMQKVGMEMSQVRGLESLIVSTRRFSEVINYIKNQAGKDTAKSKNWRAVAEILLKQLQELQDYAVKLGGDDPAMVMEAKLKLVRGWCKQVVSHYLFEKARPDIQGGG